MQQRISLITLGVRDLHESKQFYCKLGFDDRSSDESVVFFQCGSMVLGLWSRAELAQDSGVIDAGGWGGVTLAYNVSSPEEVDEVIEEARLAGATIVREPVKVFWGGYSGVFCDLDGHPWEVAHNPYWTLGDDGSISL